MKSQKKIVELIFALIVSYALVMILKVACD